MGIFSFQPHETLYDFWVLAADGLEWDILQSKPVFFWEGVLEASAGSADSLNWLAVVACSATCPVIHHLKSLILVAKETTTLFQVSVAYSCSEVDLFCFLHFLSDFSWQYTALLQYVVKPVCSASMWRKLSFCVWFLESSLKSFWKRKVVNKCVWTYSLFLLQRYLSLPRPFALLSPRPTAESVALISCLFGKFTPVPEGGLQESWRGNFHGGLWWEKGGWP